MILILPNRGMNIFFLQAEKMPSGGFQVGILSPVAEAKKAKVGLDVLRFPVLSDAESFRCKVPGFLAHLEVETARTLQKRPAWVVGSQFREKCRTIRNASAILHQSFPVPAETVIALAGTGLLELIRVVTHSDPFHTCGAGLEGLAKQVEPARHSEHGMRE